MSSITPDIEKRKCIRDRPGNTFPNRFLSIICSHDERVSCFWIGITSEWSRKSLLCHGIDTTTAETLNRCIFSKFEVDDIEISPYFLHGVILELITDSTIDQNTFIFILFDEIFRKFNDIFRSYLVTSDKNGIDSVPISGSILCKFSKFRTHFEKNIVRIFLEYLSSLGSFSGTLNTS